MSASNISSLKRRMQLPLKTLSLFSFLVAFMCSFLAVSNTTPLYILAACGVLFFMTSEGSRPNWYQGLFLLFVLYLYFQNAFLFPDVTSFPFRRKILLAFLAGMALYFTCKSRQMHCFHLLNHIFLLCTAPLLVGVLAGVTDIEQIFLSTRIRLLFNHPNTLGMVAAACIISGMSFLLFSNDAGVMEFLRGSGSKIVSRLFSLGNSKLLLAIILLYSLVFAILPLTRTAFFPLVGITLAQLGFFSLTRYGWIKTLVFFFVFFLALCLFWQVSPAQEKTKDMFFQRMIAAMSAPWKEPTFISRTPAWKSAYAAYLESPLTGKGPESYRESHLKYVHEHYAELTEEFGETLVQNDTLRIVSPHNQYLLILTEYGAIGLAFFLLLIAVPLYYGLRRRACFGEIVPLLVFFCFCFIVDNPLHSSRSMTLLTTLFFMLLGYFSCTLDEKTVPQKTQA